MIEDYHLPCTTYGDSNAAAASDALEGVTQLSPRQVQTTPLSARCKESQPSMYWEEVLSSAPGRKRKIKKVEALELVVVNPSKLLCASFGASLPASTNPSYVSGVQLPLGTLVREIPRDVTPSLPASLGKQVRFLLT